MTDRETLDKAKALFTGATQGDMLAREVIAIAERNAKKAALCREVADQKDKEIADLRSQRDELWAMLTPLKDAVLFARAQRRPMGIGQDSEIGRPTVTIEVCPRYGREKHNPGFHLEADTLGPGDAEGPSATKQIAVALLRLAYAVADKVRLRP